MPIQTACPSQQTPLRDTYISATEPVFPFHSNFVIIDLVACPDGHVLNLQGKATIGAANAPIWKSPAIGTDWNWESDQPFYQNTHGVRTWSNTGFWYPQAHYCSSDIFLPHSRSRKCPEAQYGDALFLHALLNGMGYLQYAANNDLTVPAQLDSGPAGLLAQYNKLNDLAKPPPVTGTPVGAGLPNVGGLNLTLFNIRAVKTVVSPAVAAAAAAAPAAGVASCKVPPCIPSCIVTSAGRVGGRAATRFGTPTQPALTITIWPVISGTSATTPVAPYNDWDGITGSSLSNYTFNGVQPLPTIQYSVHPRQKCFYVTLPVQLYTLSSIGTDTDAGQITFTKQDLEGTSPAPNMEVLAVKLRGTFVDETGTQTVPAALAAGIQFKIVSPAQRSPVQLTLSYQENTAQANRPIYCFEAIEGGYADEAYDAYIPVFDADCAATLPFNPSLLFTPRCAPGIWTNLVDPSNNA